MITRERCETAFTVASYESDLTGTLSVFSLFNRFQDLAGIHASYLQVGYERLRDLKLAWILSRINLRIQSLPRWGDEVRLATWPKGVDRLFAMRDFCLESGNGEPLILATSAWLLVDIVKNRPQRIETLPIDLKYPGASHAIPETPEKLQMPAGMRPVMERPVWLSDIDTNQHVNNAQYAKWICDCFTEDRYRTGRLRSIQINFLEEALLGDTIDLQIAPEDRAAEEFYIEGKNKAKGSTVVQARITWQ